MIDPKYKAPTKNSTRRVQPAESDPNKLVQVTCADALCLYGPCMHHGQRHSGPVCASILTAVASHTNDNSYTISTMMLVKVVHA